MSKLELISKQTRIAFREYFVANDVLRTIRDAFEAADIGLDDSYVPPNCTGDRRTLIEQYYHTLDLTKSGDANRLLSAYRGVRERLERLASEDDNPRGKFLKEQFQKLTNLLRRDGWQYQGGEIPSTAQGTSFENLEEHASAFSLEHIRQEIERIKQCVETDRGHAIGTSKELVESCCKTILTARGVEFERGIDLMPLVKLTVKQLKLMPDDVDSAEKGAELIKQLLHKLGAIVHEIGEIRNLYGTGHGKHGHFKGLSPPHARLVAGAAGTLSLFLFETHIA